MAPFLAATRHNRIGYRRRSVAATMKKRSVATASTVVASARKTTETTELLGDRNSLPAVTLQRHADSSHASMLLRRSHGRSDAVPSNESPAAIVASAALLTTAPSSSSQHHMIGRRRRSVAATMRKAQHRDRGKSIRQCDAGCAASLQSQCHGHQAARERATRSRAAIRGGGGAK